MVRFIDYLSNKIRFYSVQITVVIVVIIFSIDSSFLQNNETK